MNYNFFKLVAVLTMFSCSGETPSKIQASFAYPYCRTLGGAGAEDSFSCGGRSCSHDVVGDESSVCVVDEDAMSRVGLQYHIADGYDLISDDTKPSCLVTPTEKVREISVNRTDDEFEVIRDHQTFYNKTTTTKKFGIGGFFGWLFGGGFARSKTTVEETETSSESFYLMASFSVIKKELSFSEREPRLKAVMKQALLNNPKEFRTRCGDQYVSKAFEGGKIFLTFKADLSSSKKYKKESVETAFKMGLGGLFSVTTTTQHSEEVREILENMKITSKCSSVGASPELCAKHQLDEESYKLGDDVLKSRIEQAKKDLISEVEKGNIASVDIELEDYPLNIANTKKYFDYFYDYRDIRKRLSVWADDFVRIEENCDNFDFPASVCMNARIDYETQVDICMKQSSFDSPACQKENVESNSVDLVLNLGTVTFYQDSGKSGKSHKIDLTELSVNSEIVPGKIYNFTSLPFGLKDVSSLDFNLKGDWKLVLYKQSNGLGESLHVASEGQMRNANFFSFEIIRK